MIDYVLLILACFLNIEIFLKFKFTIYLKSLGMYIKKVFHIIISSDISDHWKEKMVPVYALIILKNSLILLGVLLLIIFTFSLFAVFSNNYFSIIFSISGLLTSILASYLYLMLRNFLNE
jgi:hypothetical protein